jgi:hypothetical protein
VILPGDDAIKAPDAWGAYLAAGFDESKLKLEGEPTRFTLRRMSYDQAKRADEHSGPDMVEFVVRASLTQISNYSVHVSAGERGELRLAPEDFEHAREFDRPMIKVEWMRKANLGPALLQLLAQISRTNLSEASVPFVSV